MQSIPLVAGLAFRERLATLPAEFRASLAVEPHNPYNPRAIAVIAGNGKVGYIAPEVARELYDTLARRDAAGCVVKQGRYSPTTGVLGIVEI